MTRKPLRRCHRCGKLSRQRCCVIRQPSNRGSATARGYGGAWPKTSKAFLRAHPICKDCGGAASECHHIKKQAEAPALKYDFENLMPLCKSCHAVRTRQGE